MLKKLIKFLLNKLPKPEGYWRMNLYETAKQSVGMNLCLNREYGSGETLNTLIKKATGKEIGGDNSTSLIYWFLNQDKKRFLEIQRGDLLPGDIVIVPTGSGADHEGIGNAAVVGENVLYSNNHLYGKLDNHINLDDFYNYYSSKNFTVKFFRLK